ncbi:hypothetical protein D3C75_894500 [compost metagenome]
MGDRRRLQHHQLHRLADIVVLLGQLSEGRQKQLHGPHIVARGNEAENVVQIGHFHLDIVVLPQPVLHIKAGQAQLPDMDGQLGGVQIIGGAFPQNLTAEAAQTWDLVDPFPGIVAQADSLIRHSRPVKRQIAPRGVQ